MFRFLLFCVYVTTMLYCAKSVVLNTGNDSPKLVVNSVFAKDSIWQVQVSSSLPVQGQVKFLPVKTAKVEIIDAAGNTYILDQYVEPNGKFDLGYFTNSTILKPIEGNTYTLSVSDPDYLPVTAIDTMPYKIEAKNFKLNSVIVENKNANSIFPGFLLKANLNFEFSKNNTLPKEVFLAIRIYYFADYHFNTLSSISNGIQLIDTIKQETLNYKALNIPEGITSYVWKGTTIFKLSKDELPKNIQLSISSLMDLKDTIPTQFFVEVVNISEQLYKYHESYTQQVTTINDPFSEIVNVYSNIEGGLGIFGAFNSSVTRIKLPE